MLNKLIVILEWNYSGAVHSSYSLGGMWQISQKSVTFSGFLSFFFVLLCKCILNIRFLLFTKTLWNHCWQEIKALQNYWNLKNTHCHTVNEENTSANKYFWGRTILLPSDFKFFYGRKRLLQNLFVSCYGDFPFAVIYLWNCVVTLSSGCRPILCYFTSIKYHSIEQNHFSG